jgi:quercetin dioxygenase-like cupin family protein
MSTATKQSPKHMPSAEAVRLGDLVNYQKGAVVSRTLIKHLMGTVTVFAFDAGQELSEHTAAFDALVQMIEGKAQILVAGKVLHVEAGQAILLPANQRHALAALTPFKLLLTMIRS